MAIGCFHVVLTLALLVDEAVKVVVLAVSLQDRQLPTWNGFWRGVRLVPCSDQSCAWLSVSHC